MGYIEKGTKEFLDTNVALFAGGFNTFAILYSTQPILPYLTKEFGISPTMASLSLSVTTITLAVSMLVMGSLSEVWGRKSIMTFSITAASILAIVTSFTQGFASLLVIRVLQGIVLAGLPAIAMAYISEEVEKTSLGMAMGLYISGNSIGGMGGRIIIGFLTDAFHWRIALGSIGAIGIAASLLFWLKLPPSRHFKAREFEIGKLLNSMESHLKNPGLLRLYCIGFLLMGSFVSLYNYIGFQLIDPPYSLDPALVSFIFVIYIVGTFSSTWMGRLADNHGHHKVLRSAILLMFAGAATTLHMHLVLKVFGIALLTFGFFGGHSIVSSWVGRLASHDRAQASSLYLFFYYAGSSVGGTSAGVFWTNYGWGGVISMITCFLISALFLSTRFSSG
ncbi:MFS transporter [Anaerosolibacter sp.]|uniref:MFS transporter n=1 Tax=Anaerosolibacter sp. TaxID=1872527 RepID=UPI0039F11854